MSNRIKQITVKSKNFKAVNVFICDTEFDGSQALRVTKDPIITEDDEPNYARLLDCDFRNGIIEVSVFSKLLPDAPEHARGFIGIAFRINEEDSQFEAIYIRPTNSRCDIQLRRNRSVQYFSYPNFKFAHSRVSNPGEYESYADMDMLQWIDLKIIVDGEKAKLYLNKSEQPVLVVNDLKHGADNTGALGLWVDIGTEGFFKDLKYTSE